MKRLSIALQKRNSDAPLVRFLPAGDALRDADGENSCPASLELTGAEFDLLDRAAAGMETTLENLILAGYAALLSRLTRQDLVAVSVGSRDLAIFGLEGDCSFASAVRQSGRRKPDARTENRKELEQSVSYEFVAGGQEPSDGRPCGLRLAFFARERRLDLGSPSQLWQERTLRGWLDHLMVMLKAAVANPELALNRLPLWTEEAARSFYAAFNATDRDYLDREYLDRETGAEASVPGRFAVQAAKRADTVAVQAGMKRYTYRELDQRSTELARHLVAAGAGPNRAVAVCMERSVDLPMALLAVLKSGGYYVPLDPHNPSDRLRSILEECGPVAFVSDTATASGFSDSLDLGSIALLCVDQKMGSCSEEVVLPAGFAAGDLAYTIYTSGTTGKPKGVRIEHGSLLNLLCSMERKPGMDRTDRTLAVAPISFDIATMDMFLPLCTGGTLVIASREEAVDPYRLAELLERHKITVMQATPATWRMMITSGWKGLRQLRIISGGEALPRELANDLVERVGELWNCYGPTETTIYSSVLRIDAGDGMVAVGPPMDNTSFYVMDSAGFPVPAGVPGELYIGGVGVSPGYVARPELTAQRFVTDTFGDKPGRLLFATGDLVRVVHGNQLEFFGRLDHQVKLRGFRIELGEIESVLRSHPSISDAVVILREDVPGEPRLVAYVIGDGSPLDTAKLRVYAAKKLPEYMLPSVTVELEKYPLSASGKINRRALPLPESVIGARAEEAPAAEAAAGEIEAKLLEIFREVLRNDSIGVTDSFFRYGGYSLLTVKLFARIDSELGVRLPITLLFDAPTVRELAHVIQRGVVPSVIVPIRPYGRSAPMFVVQSYLLYNVMLEIVEQDRPIYGVREMGDKRESQPVEALARHYAQEILKVYSDGPLYLAGWCAAGSLTVEIARQLRASGHQVGLVALFDAECPGQQVPRGFMAWCSRVGQKFRFHRGRIRQISWKARLVYVAEALVRNWEGAVESFYAANYRSIFWMQKRFGLSLSEAAFNNVYAASLATLQDFSVQPYPGKLNLYRAADVPNFSGLDETLGWKSVAEEGVEVAFVPGDHVSMFKKPNVANLAQRLQHAMKSYEAQA